MSCPACASVVERPDIMHTVRRCPECGRIMRVHEPGKHGIGMRIRAGDEVVIPKGFLSVSLNPLRIGGQMFRPGLQWFAELVFVDELPARKDGIHEEIDKIEQSSTDLLTGSELIDGLSIDNPDDIDQIITRLQAHKDSAEWWAFLVGVFLSAVREALGRCDADAAVWAMACAERCRSMLIFKQHLEEVVWMGHSAARVLSMMRVWDDNRVNPDEGFWQATFMQHTYAISQVFAVPVVFVKDAAYVGGMNINRQNAKLVDFLMSVESSREAVLVEIKTPATKLLGAPYRGTFKPSSELVGAIVQTLDYRETLINNLGAVAPDGGARLSAFSPRCAVLIGNGAVELDTDLKRRAFERFRANSREVEIITYDEFFKKIDILANLFSLTRTASSQS